MESQKTGGKCRFKQVFVLAGFFYDIPVAGTM